MAKIDIERFVASMFTAGRFDYDTLQHVRECLMDQGLKCVDGRIIKDWKNGQQNSRLRIKKGMAYVCISDFPEPHDEPVIRKGEICVAEEDDIIRGCNFGKSAGVYFVLYDVPTEKKSVKKMLRNQWYVCTCTKSRLFSTIFTKDALYRCDIDGCLTGDDGCIHEVHPDELCNFRQAALDEIKKKVRFKPGDWIVQMLPDGKKMILCIEEICNSWYEVTDADMRRYSISFSDEGTCRPWNVRDDASKGDMLSCKAGTFVFTGTLWNGSACGYLGSNHGVFLLGSLANGVSNYWMWKDVWPARKEEREKLLEEMKNNGYMMSDILMSPVPFSTEDADARRKFEKALQSMVNDTFYVPGSSKKMTDLGAKNWAEYLLILAKDVFRHEIDREIEQAYRNSDEIVLKHGYEKGYAAALAKHGIKEDDDEEETC